MRPLATLSTEHIATLWTRHPATQSLRGSLQLYTSPAAWLRTQKATRLKNKLLRPEPEIPLIVVRGQHLEMVSQSHVTVLTAQGTGKGVAEVRMEDELSVIELGFGVIHPAV